MKSEKYFKFSLCALVFIGLAVSSCLRQNNTSNEKSIANADSLKLKYFDLQASVESTWTKMNDDEEEKLFSLNRLLEEITYTNDFDQSQIDSLKAAVKLLKSNHFDREQMSVSSSIDVYDSMNSVVTPSVVSLAKNHPKYDEYVYMDQLINEIMEADQNVLFHRIKYDNAARAYNQFLEENPQYVEKIDTSAKPQPLFAIQ